MQAVNNLRPPTTTEKRVRRDLHPEILTIARVTEMTAAWRHVNNFGFIGHKTMSIFTRWKRTGSEGIADVRGCGQGRMSTHDSYANTQGQVEQVARPTETHLVRITRPRCIITSQRERITLCFKPLISIAPLKFSRRNPSHINKSNDTNTKVSKTVTLAIMDIQRLKIIFYKSTKTLNYRNL